MSFGYGHDEASEYDTMQVCMNGHQITEYAASQPSARRAYCSSCRAPTICACQECGSRIRGHRHTPGVFVVGLATSVEPNCPDCGKPYPWTKARQEVVREWVADSQSLSAKAKETILANLQDVFDRTIRSQLAAKKISDALSEADDDEHRQITQALEDACS